MTKFRSKKIEHTIQLECIAWFRNEYMRKGEGIIIPVINEAAYDNSNFVICEGASDLIIVLQSEILFIEMKTATGRQKDKQIEFQILCESLGYRYVLCRNLNDFKDEINRSYF